LPYIKNIDSQNSLMNININNNNSDNEITPKTRVKLTNRNNFNTDNGVNLNNINNIDNIDIDDTKDKLMNEKTSPKRERETTNTKTIDDLDELSHQQSEEKRDDVMKVDDVIKVDDKKDVEMDLQQELKRSKRVQDSTVKELESKVQEEEEEVKDEKKEEKEQTQLTSVKRIKRVSSKEEDSKLNENENEKQQPAVKRSKRVQEIETKETSIEEGKSVNIDDILCKDSTTKEVKKRVSVETIVILHEYNFGDLIWAKTSKDPWWPSLIINPKKLDESIKQKFDKYEQKIENKEGYLILYYGTHQFGYVTSRQIKPYLDNREEFIKQNPGNKFKEKFSKSIDEADEDNSIDSNLRPSKPSKDLKKLF